MNQETQILLVSILVALTVVAVAVILFGQKIKSQETTTARVRGVAANKRDLAARKEAKSTSDSNAKRRQQMLQQLKEIEDGAKQKKKRASLRTRLDMAGLEIQPATFVVMSVAFGLGVAAFLYLSQYPIAVSALGGFAAGVGVPRWVVGFLAKRRINKFTEEFVVAIDIIVRGIKSGLPVNDCIQIIARECKEPVASEFATVVAGQKMGVTLDQSLERMFERIPTSEVNFFAIVLSIQQKTGGNLAEALSNLSTVLRDRKKMKGKIQAMSSEAKASSMIIGSLPFLVAGAMLFVQPNYLNPLFEEKLGNMLLIGAAVWMLSGVLIMRKMINFNF